MRRAAVTLAIIAASLAATASAAGTPSIVSATIDPSSTGGGLVRLKVSGTGIDRYEVYAECPAGLEVGAGGRSLCDGSHRLTARRLRRLLLNLRNPTHVAGTAKIVFWGIDGDGEAITPAKSISLAVTASR